MTREEAYTTIKENLCGMCAYGSQCMESCDIRSCDNRDAIKTLEQEPTTKNLAADREDAVERLNAIKQFIGYDKDSEIVKATQKSLDMAIKALEQEPIIDKINKMKSEIADSLEFWDYSPNNNPLARDILETITNFWGDIREDEK